MNTQAVLLIATAAMLGAGSPLAAQTGNPVQDAINRDMMNRAIIREATGGRPQLARKPPAIAGELYGRWLPMPETNELKNIGSGRCALLEISFTPTTEVRVTIPIGPYPSDRVTHRVTYVNRSARSVYVVPDTTTVGPYVEVIDHDHIRPEYADRCVYRRAG